MHLGLHNDTQSKQPRIASIPHNNRAQSGSESASMVSMAVEPIGNRRRHSRRQNTRMERCVELQDRLGEHRRTSVGSPLVERLPRAHLLARLSAQSALDLALSGDEQTDRSNGPRQPSSLHGAVARRGDGR